MFADTGHIAFTYRWSNGSDCCYYFAVFSKQVTYQGGELEEVNDCSIRLGLFHGWRTRMLRSSILMNDAFFFDSTGSFYFNASPPVLIIQATEQSLVATTQVNSSVAFFAVTSGAFIRS